MIVLLGLTPVTAGNVTGIGFVDFVPVAVAEQIDWEATYVNSFTAGGSGVRRGRMPMVLPDEESCIRAALQTCGKPFDAPKNVVRIRSTLHLTHCAVSDAVLADLPAGVTHHLARSVHVVTETFFTIEHRPDGSEWFVANDVARGPWDPDACHGGPPTGLLVRALEHAAAGDAPGAHRRRSRAGRSRWPGSRSSPRSPAPGAPPPTRRPRSSTATARSGRRRRACTWPSPRRRCSRRASTTATW